jgi:molybdopterin converting factor small subunit
MPSTTTAIEQPLELSGLAPDPMQMWKRLHAFLGLDEAEVRMMRRTSETLLRDAADFVVGAYDYLASFDETASVLSWEKKMNEEHLQERRQFFATWMARAIGVDLSDEFAEYLFMAGKYHAAHGPRQIHTPEQWEMVAVAIVQAHFADRIILAGHKPEVASAAIGGWNKYLMLQAYQMQAGYRVAVVLDAGTDTVEIKLFGRLQEIGGREQQTVRINQGAILADTLRKFFDYHPALRQEFFDLSWRSPEGDGDATWMTDLEQVYVPKQGPHWRILHNGRDVSYQSGFDAPLSGGDVISFFPPGR